jgi:hypothetical protein
MWFRLRADERIVPSSEYRVVAASGLRLTGADHAGTSCEPNSRLWRSIARELYAFAWFCMVWQRRRSQVAKARACKALIPGSNPGAASNHHLTYSLAA